MIKTAVAESWCRMMVTSIRRWTVRAVGRRRWTVAFLSIGSIVMTKMSIKGEIRSVERGFRYNFEHSSLGAQCSVFSVRRSFREHFCCSCWSWLLLVILGFFCLLKSSFVTFREEVLKTLLLMSSFFVLVQRRGLADFFPPICSATAEIDLQSLEPFVPF